MKHRLFKVTVHFSDVSNDVYNVIAKDDQEARKKALALDAKLFKENSVPGDKPEKVMYCEIEFQDTVDAL